jgi:phosphoribosylformylglycinamidine synthase
MWRLEIGYVEGENNPYAQALKNQIKEDLGIKLAAVKVYDVYYLDHHFQPEELSKAVKAIFVDPVLQKASLNASLSQKADYLAEVRFLPGVTDNVGNTAAEVLTDYFQLPKKPEVYSARLYAFKGDLTKKTVSKIVYGLLANPLINDCLIFSGKEWSSLNLAELKPKKIKKSQAPEMTYIKLPHEPKALMRLSQERLLSLSLEEMQAIAAYYQSAIVQKKREKVGLLPYPTDVELETLAQTWSEHCKHKIFNSQITFYDRHGQKQTINSLFKTYIKKATEEISKEKDWLVSVFSDNAGIISFNLTHNVVFKVETHNHPSALDPYGGALTGIVGVNRDPLGTGLGAELIFNTDVFCFGLPDLPASQLPEGVLHPKRVFRGVRKGVEDGGNKIGIPTVNGSIFFHPRYTYNPLVFCGTGGIMPKNINGRPSHLKEVLPGDLIVMVGGRIGKDGIHGATFSSASLDETVPTTVVQIGAPIVQKKMMAALLEARDLNLYRAITDNGAGGLSSSVGEMAQLSGGAEVWLEKAPTKYPGLAPWEIWVSESQERMTLAVPPKNITAFLKLMQCREVEATVIGTFTDSGYLKVTYHNQVVLYLNLNWLHNGLPTLKLVAKELSPSQETSAPTEQRLKTNGLSPTGLLFKALSHLNVCSREKVIRQYDHEVQGTSVIKPLVGAFADGPSDAAVIKPLVDDNAGLAISCGLNPNYGLIDSYWMATAAIDEAIRNCVAVGADPAKIALLDNFCWGNPVKSGLNPDGDLKLGQLVKAAQGCYEAAVAFGTPFISGKDSFYNEYKIKDKTVSIPPTLLISALGYLPDVNKAVTMDAKTPGDFIYIVGITKAELGGSIYS